MTKIVELMDEMAATLTAAFSGNDLKDIQVEPRRIFNPSPLSLDIYPAETFRSTDEAGFGDVSGGYIFTVRARVSTADYEAGQDVLLALMDDEDDLSVATALMDDQTLNGKASSVDVSDSSGFAMYVDPGAAGALLGVEWKATIVNLTS